MFRVFPNESPQGFLLGRFDDIRLDLIRFPAFHSGNDGLSGFPAFSASRAASNAALRTQSRRPLPAAKSRLIPRSREYGFAGAIPPRDRPTIRERPCPAEKRALLCRGRRGRIPCGPCNRNNQTACAAGRAPGLLGPPRPSRRAFPRISRHGGGSGAWQDRSAIPWAVRFRKTGEFP